MHQRKNWLGHMPPREKLLSFGASTLSDVELLAIFIRTGVPGQPIMQYVSELLSKFGSLYHLMTADYQQFVRYKGLGIVKYTQLQAVLELSKRFLQSKLNYNSVMNHPDAVYHYLAEQLAHSEREIFVAMFLNNQHQLIRCEVLFLGTFNEVEVHPREVIRLALNYNASAIILAHNHPSGLLEPSKEDIEVTYRIQDAAALFSIQILDHLIISACGYSSLLSLGYLKNLLDQSNA